jgi:hypothetical protein
VIYRGPAGNDAETRAALFYLLRDAGVVHDYLSLFTPVRWELDINMDLITEHIAAGNQEAAISICRSQIGTNTKEEFDLRYLKLLRKLYADTGNTAGEAEVMARLLPLNFDFEAYEYIRSHTPEGSRKELRDQIFTQARHAWSRGNEGAMSFCFRLLLSEGNSKKLIGLIDGLVPYALLEAHADELAAADKEGFIKKLLNRQEASILGLTEAYRQARTQQIEALVSVLSRHFSADELGAALRDYSIRHPAYKSDNELVKYLRSMVQ